MKYLFPFFAAIVLFALDGCRSTDTLDHIPPEVKVNDPEHDEVGAPISITVDATDNVAVTNVSFFVDGVFLDRKSTPPYTFYWYSDYWGDGRQHILSATALDRSGNIGLSKTVSVDVIKTTKPTVEVLSPLQNEIIGQEHVLLTWKPIENTTSYTVQVSDTISTNFLIIDAKTNTTSMTVDLPEERTYRWRVLPVAVGNIFGGWNKENVFHRTNQFTSIFGRKNFDALSAVSAASDGGLILAGSTHSFEKGGILIKTFPAGKIQWERYYGGMDISWFTTVIQTLDGGYLAAGQNTSKAAPSDRWFVKTDSMGNLEWSKTIMLPGSQGVNSVIQTSDSGYIVCGFSDTDSNTIDIIITKYDASFDVIWERTFGGRYHDEAFHIAATADGGLLLCGVMHYGTDYASDRAVVIRLNFLGEEKWRRALTAAGGARFVSSAEHNGTYYFCGTSRSADLQQDALVAAFDSAGNQLWSKTFGTSHDDAATGMTFQNNQIAVCGSISTDSVGSRDAWLLLLSENGIEKLSKHYGGKNYDGASAIVPYNNGFAIVGSTTSFSSGSSDGFLLITDAVGNVLPDRR